MPPRVTVLESATMPEGSTALFRLVVTIFSGFVGLVLGASAVVGVEYQADMATVIEAVKERKMRIIRESHYEKDLAGNKGYALHTHPGDGFGASYEFYHDDFHQ